MLKRTPAIAFIAALLWACPLIYEAPELPEGPKTEDGGPPPQSGLTWHDDVAPILADHCLRCHEEGGIAPFPLGTYAQAKPMAGAIAASTRSRSMPPFLADGSGECGEWVDANWLSDAQIQTLTDWAATGAAEGESKPAPEVPPLPTIEAPDLTVTMPVSYLPDDGVSDDYRCFLVDPELTENIFVTRYEVVPGDPRVVHHVILYSPANAGAERAAEARDGEGGRPGYSCYGGSGVPSNMLAAWAPGTGAVSYPAGTGLELPAGRKLILQMHYNMVNGAFEDRTSIRLETASQVDSPGLMRVHGFNEFAIPPGEASYTVKNAVTAREAGAAQAIRLWGLIPHMHELGTTFRLERIRNGERHCLVDVKHWDFNWQLGYFLHEPVELRPTDQLEITCNFDSSRRTEITRFGEDTMDEMCLAMLYLTP